MGFFRNTKTATSVSFKASSAALAVMGLFFFISQARSQTNAQLTQKVREEERLIESNPKLAKALAERIAHSSIGDRISLSKNSLEKTKEIEAWLLKNPQAGAIIGLGLEADDANGNHDFENRMNQELSQLEPNPGAVHNAYYRLKRASKQERSMLSDKTMTNEERVEILNNLFEGRGSGSKAIIRRMRQGSSPQSPDTTLTGNFYNRLSASNLSGYSPAVAALQSQMARENIPGVPPLVVTGYLGYKTLSYPSYGMKFDVSNLKLRLNEEEALALAKELGIKISNQQAKDPATFFSLLSKAQKKGISLPRDFQVQSKTIARAEKAIAAFDEFALKGQNPKEITLEFIRRLGNLQKESSRWINAAFLEGEISRILKEEKNLSPQLREAIAACPVTDQERGEYLQRGQNFFDRLNALNLSDSKALTDLVNHWPQKSAEADRLMQGSSQIRPHLFTDVEDFIMVPYRLSSIFQPEPRWKSWADKIAREFFSWTAYGQKLKALDGERKTLKNVFLSIAIGDQTAARRMLHP
jgi:hypothetical protein